MQARDDIEVVVPVGDLRRLIEAADAAGELAAEMIDRGNRDSDRLAQLEAAGLIDGANGQRAVDLQVSVARCAGIVREANLSSALRMPTSIRAEDGADSQNTSVGADDEPDVSDEHDEYDDGYADDTDCEDDDLVLYGCPDTGLPGVGRSNDTGLPSVGQPQVTGIDDEVPY